MLELLHTPTKFFETVSDELRAKILEEITEGAVIKRRPAAERIKSKQLLKRRDPTGRKTKKQAIKRAKTKEGKAQERKVIRNDKFGKTSKGKIKRHFA